jgi:hypothetical protein
MAATYRQPKLRMLAVRIGAWLLTAISVANAFIIWQAMQQPSLPDKPKPARTARTARRALGAELPSAERVEIAERLAVLGSTIMFLSASGAVISLVSTVAFAAWYCRMQLNLPALQSETQPSPLTSFISLIFPAANLFTTFMMLLDLWAESDPGRLHDTCDRPHSARIVVLWWLVMLGGVLLGISGTLMLCDPTSKMEQSLPLMFASSVALSLEPLLFISILSILRGLQERRRFLIHDPLGQEERAGRPVIPRLKARKSSG